MPRDPLFAEIRHRHTNKGAYDDHRKLPGAQWSQLAQTAQSAGLLAGGINEPAGIAGVRALTRASYEIETITPRTWLESARLLRIGPSEIVEHRDGITLNTSMPRLLDGLGLFDRYAVPARGDSNFNRMMDRWQPYETGSGYLWIATPAATRALQLGAGRAYARTDDRPYPPTADHAPPRRVRLKTFGTCSDH